MYVGPRLRDKRQS
uniref:Uncharacterized protein n=1 Tax=Rhizophora mucronata TaxID=61149 RepID=A0A2P2MYV0_RHIMU